MKQIIVTVGREHGSGGKYIAEQIARRLGIHIMYAPPLRPATAWSR